MPPKVNSRHLYTLGIMNPSDSTDRLFLTSRVPYRFVNLSDNISHKVDQGDTLHNIAARYYAPFERPAGLWWIVADFQPQPVHDPTVRLTPGSVVILPGLRTVQEEIFNEARRDLQ